MGSVALCDLFRDLLQRSHDVRRWVIAHSGGLDSQVLLHLAAQHLPTDQILVLHINHHLQPQASAWAAFSATQAQQLGLRHKTIDVSPEDASEEKARAARYAAFTSVVQSGDCLLQAHHCDDQAETLLYRLLRGSGLRGLGAMPQQRTLSVGVLCRPLLSVPRAELEAYARAHGLEWINDPSNLDEGYDRNYLRHTVMPLLNARWPGVARRWQNTALQLRDTQQVLDEYLDQDLTRLCGPLGELRLSQMEGLAVGRRDLLLLRWLQRAGVTVGRRQLDEIVATVIQARTDAQPQLKLGGWWLRRYRDGLYLTPDQLSAREGLAQLALGAYRLSDGVLSVSWSETGLASLDGVSMVRRQGGERCRPAGRGGSCTVKQCLQEAGIPVWLRTDWPLLVADDEVVAVAGVCICEGWQGKNGGYALSWRSFALSEQG